MKLIQVELFVLILLVQGKPLECPVCKDPFSGLELLRSHYDSTHPDSPSLNSFLLTDEECEEFDGSGSEEGYDEQGTFYAGLEKANARFKGETDGLDNSAADSLEAGTSFVGIAAGLDKKASTCQTGGIDALDDGESVGVQNSFSGVLNNS